MYHFGIDADMNNSTQIVDFKYWMDLSYNNGNVFTEDEAYYYHTDHLGSSSEIVHKENIIQKLDYLPFGELWSDKRYSGDWEAPYAFPARSVIWR